MLVKTLSWRRVARVEADQLASFRECYPTNLLCVSRPGLCIKIDTHALPADTPPFDLVFIDADKKRCGEYCTLLLERGLLAPHALVLIDYVLRKDQVCSSASTRRSPSTRQARVQ